MLAAKLSYRYTKKGLKQLLKSLVILVNTREQKNDHIIDYLDDKDITYKSKKLNYGDSSFYPLVDKNQNFCGWENRGRGCDKTNLFFYTCGVEGVWYTKTTQHKKG